MRLDRCLVCKDSANERKAREKPQDFRGSLPECRLSWRSKVCKRAGVRRKAAGFSRELARVPPVLAKQSVQTSGRAREKPQDFRGSNSGKRGLAHCLQLGAARFLRSAVTAKTVAVTGIPEAVTEKTGALTVSPVRLRETRPAGRPVPVCGVGGLRNCPVTALRRDRSS